MSRIISLAACLVLAAALALAQTKSAIQKLEDQWSAAFNKGDAGALAAMYTDDAYVLPPGAEMVKGRSAIGALWGKEMQQRGDVKCTTLDVKPLGARAAGEVGTCTFKKGAPTQEGTLKYAVVWEKSGHTWRLLQDTWNTSK